MILMWLGSLVLMQFGLMESQKHVAEFFSRWQKPIYEKKSEHSFRQLFAQALFLVFLEVSPQKSLYTSLALYDLRATRRLTVLLMCLSGLGIWWTLLVAFLFLNFNGFFLLGIGILGWLSFSLIRRCERAFKIIFAIGVFLVGGETALRNASVVQTLLGQSDWAFFLADGRFYAVLSIALAAFIAGLFMRFENWQLVVSLGLLTTSTISFSGALGLLVGAKLAEVAMFWWYSRRSNQDCWRLGNQYAWVAAAALVLGFIFAGELRTSMNWGFTIELLAFQEKSLQFLLCAFMIYLIQVLCLLVWGYFSGSGLKAKYLKRMTPSQQISTIKNHGR